LDARKNKRMRGIESPASVQRDQDRDRGNSGVSKEGRIHRRNKKRRKKKEKKVQRRKSWTPFKQVLSGKRELEGTRGEVRGASGKGKKDATFQSKDEITRGAGKNRSEIAN